MSVCLSEPDLSILPDKLTYLILQRLELLCLGRVADGLGEGEGGVRDEEEAHAQESTVLDGDVLHRVDVKRSAAKRTRQPQPPHEVPEVGACQSVNATKVS